MLFFFKSYSLEVYTSKEDKFQLLDKAIQFHDGNSIIAVSIVCLGLSLFLELVYYM